MPPIEMGPLRPIVTIDNRIARPADTPGKSPSRAAQTRPTVIASDALDPGAPSIDAARVAEIRKAIETGTYPMNPTRIADAMIAAGYLLWSAK